MPTYEGPDHTVHIPEAVDDGFTRIDLIGGERGCYFRIISVSFSPFRDTSELDPSDFDECLEGLLCFFADDNFVRSYCIRDIGFLTHAWRTAAADGQATVETHSGRLLTEMRVRGGMMQIRFVLDGRAYEFVEPIDRFRERFREVVLSKVQGLIAPVNANIAQMVCDYVGVL